MAKQLPHQLRKNEKVFAAVDLPGVPAGTRGKVGLVNGLTWIRYWVYFDNGVDIGSLDRKVLARPDEWKAIQAESARAAAAAS